jgi:hypothetical protein
MRTFRVEMTLQYEDTIARDRDAEGVVASLLRRIRENPDEYIGYYEKVSGARVVLDNADGTTTVFEADMTPEVDCDETV